MRIYTTDKSNFRLSSISFAPDIRTGAKDWIKKHVPVSSIIAMCPLELNSVTIIKLFGLHTMQFSRRKPPLLRCASGMKIAIILLEAPLIMPGLSKSPIVFALYKFL